jgi:hypothetical protein
MWLRTKTAIDLPTEGSVSEAELTGLREVLVLDEEIKATVWLKALRFLMFAFGFFAIVWPFFDQHFRDGENNYIGLFCLPMAVGIGVLVTAFVLGSEWQRSAFWFLLAIVGFAVSLQLVNAGWQLRYQHYKPFGELFESYFLRMLAVFLAVQVVLVLAGLRSAIGQIAAWCLRNFKWWRLLLVVLIFLISTTTVSQNVTVYIQEWAFAVGLQIVNLATVILVARSIPQEAIGTTRRSITAVFGDVSFAGEAGPGPPDRFCVTAAVFVAILSAALCVFSYQRHPHVTDEVAYLTQARFLAAGALTMPAPPVPEGFEVYLMDYKGNTWFPVPPPGWPIMLAVGAFFGLAWLVNPMLAGVNVLLAYVLLREMYPKGVARIAIVLLVLSPWYIFLGMSFMTHMFSLTCALAASIGVACSRRNGKAVWAFAGGLALGTLSMVRPLEAVAVAGLLGLWAMGIGGKRLKMLGIAGLIIGSMVSGGVGLAYNAALAGDPLKFPINAYTDKYFGKNSNAYGFGPDRGMGWEQDPYPGHGPVDALVNSNLNVSSMNVELFGWSIGSFLIVALGLCLGRLRRSDYLMLAVIGAIYGLHFFYYFSGGPDFGARYWFLMIVPLVVLAARGLVLLAAKIDENAEAGDARVWFAAAALCLMTVTVFVPWRAIDKYHNFRGMRPDVRNLATNHHFGESLVLIRGNKDPDYASAAVYNPLDFEATAPIYAWDRDKATRKRLLKAYETRNVWIIDGPSLTKRGYEIVAGPVPATELLKDIE